MKTLKKGLSGIFILTAFYAQAAYQVEFTFNNGTVRTVKDPKAQGGQVILTPENTAVPFSQIRSAVFLLEGITSEDCQNLLECGAYDELAARLNDALASVEQGLEIPGNIDLYIQYKLRACFWIRQLDEAERCIGILRAKNSPLLPLAELYNVLILIERNRADEAAGMFKNRRNPDDGSASMSEYIRGRLAMNKREYEAALQHFANILIRYRHDPEWMPAATFAEGDIYKKTGYLEAAANVAGELMITYPDTYWGRRAAELK
jgi:tetratricopeptide (TPR) repeat protein